MPSLPVMFWNDPVCAVPATAYSYFSEYPGVWRHGDWIKTFPTAAA
ncbi:hypothetical protein [Streptosporangium vulgare]